MPTRNYQADLMARLASKDYAALYIETAFRESCQDQDWAAFGLALRNVIEAQERDVAQLARDAGVSRQHLYLLFGKGANPTLNTLVPLLDELDLSLRIQSGLGENKRRPNGSAHAGRALTRKRKLRSGFAGVKATAAA